LKVFVTGATGFIGRALVKKLIEEKHDIVALARRPSHNLPSCIQVVYGDIADPASFADSLKDCRRFYHLAAMISFDPHRRNQLLMTNGKGTENVLSAASRSGIDAAVVVSSACTMGLALTKDDLLDEGSHPDQATINNNPYLESKLASEKAALDFSKRFKVVIVNPTTVYGPGDFTLNSGALIKMIATSFIAPVPPGGSNVIDVSDVVNGIILAGEHGKTGSRYILGAHNLLFKEIFLAISGVVRKRPVFLPVPSGLRRPFSIMAGAMGKLKGDRFLTSQIINDLFLFKYYSIKKAAKELDFEPRYSFRGSIERAWAFYQQNNLI
jgi:dihydroflavonol-4-reductase